MHVPPPASFRKAIAAAALVLGACSGPALEPLINEPAAAASLVAESRKGMAARGDPAIAALDRFVAACQASRNEDAYTGLSVATRRALRTRAAGAGLRGIDLFRKRAMPAGEDPDKLEPFDPLGFFLGGAPKKVELAGARRSEFEESEGRTVEVQLQLESPRGPRRVTMRFEGTRWRLHAPAPFGG